MQRAISIPWNARKRDKSNSLGNADFRQFLRILERVHLLRHQSISGFAFSREQVVVDLGGGWAGVEGLGHDPAQVAVFLEDGGSGVGG